MVRRGANGDGQLGDFLETPDLDLEAEDRGSELPTPEYVPSLPLFFLRSD
jgi:hypothetical protein